MKRIYAFSLIEVLVVTAIVAVLASITLSLIVGAKRSAKTTEAISNMRQCMVSVLIYMDDSGDSLPPSYKIARTLVNPLTACDKNDFWPAPCSSGREEPMIGSFGYIRGAAQYGDDASGSAELRSELQANPSKVPILVDVFASSNRFLPISPHGEGMTSERCGMGMQNCKAPDRMLAVTLDTSIGPLIPYPGNSPSNSFGVWDGLFLSYHR